MPSGQYCIKTPQPLFSPCSISTAAALFYGTPILFYGTSYVWQSLILDMKNALFLVPFASSKPRNCFCCVWHSWLAVQQIVTQLSHWGEIIYKGAFLVYILAKHFFFQFLNQVKIDKRVSIHPFMLGFIYNKIPASILYKCRLLK